MADVRVDDKNVFNDKKVFKDCPLEGADYILGYGATIKQFKRILVSNNVSVSDAIFVISFDDGSFVDRYQTITTDWSNLVKLVRNSDFLVYCSGVLTTPFKLKAFEHAYVLV